jgi:hypothetical protein
MFITKRQQEALLALAATERGYMYFSTRKGCWYNFVTDSGYFASRTINILIDAGWVGRGTLPADPLASVDIYAGEEVVALTPEGRKLAKLLSARK